MKGSEEGNGSPEWVSTVITIVATVIGAAFALIIGVICVSTGFWEGLFVLLLTIVGAIVGRFYVASEQPWWGRE